MSNSSTDILIPRSPDIIKLITPPTSPPKLSASMSIPSTSPIQGLGISTPETKRENQKRKREVEDVDGEPIQDGDSGKEIIGGGEGYSCFPITEPAVKYSNEKIDCDLLVEEDGDLGLSWAVEDIRGWDGDFEDQSASVEETDIETEPFPDLDDDYAMALLMEMEMDIDF
ncbi:hypothetical protein EG329_010327 [Mollisiaceae sp. DMI_Dod_QoI]|nr:hypothetical protein EG329_010327 [Helotiales sp. DMI_Dod_QoI]